jgi:hypothetical protein
MGIRLRSGDSVNEAVSSDELRVMSEEQERFFALAKRLCESTDPAERERLKEELARMTFGE